MRKNANSMKRFDDKLDVVLGSTRYIQGLSSRPFEASGVKHADTPVGTRRCSNGKGLVVFCCLLCFLWDGGHTSAACQACLGQSVAFVGLGLRCASLSHA